MKVENLLRDNNIYYAKEHEKHYREGWLNIKCPFCTGNPGFHGGLHAETGTYTCWRCGKHKLTDLLSTLLHINKYQAWELINNYSGRSKTKKSKLIKRVKKLEIPGKLPLDKRSIDYLKSRGISKPKKLVKKWNLFYSGNIGQYKHRIIAPIYDNDYMVSFHARDITGRKEKKHMACNKKKEVIDHRDCLYTSQFLTGNKIIIVEGLMDAWKMGIFSVATFGIKFSFSQISKLRKFKKIFVMYDDEPQAQKQAKKLCNYLSAFVSTENIYDYGTDDPGKLTEKVAKKIVKQLGF